MLSVREIGEEELSRLVAVRNAVWPGDPETVEGYVDWRRQAEDMIWLLAEDDGADAGAGVAIHGWHSEPGVGRVTVAVLPAHRGRGTGGALLRHLGGWLAERGCAEATAGILEGDDASLGWAERRGFEEIGRDSILALDLDAIEAPPVDPPGGLRVLAWSERPELASGLYRVYVESAPDIPGEEAVEAPSFEDWLRNDMQGAGDRPEATFAALAGEEVVGYAKLSLTRDETEIAWHDLTGVLRAWRGRGVAGALKRAEIAWAKREGLRWLKTFNEERNEPIRRLNERYGYRPEPGFVRVRGPVGPAAEADG